MIDNACECKTEVCSRSEHARIENYLMKFTFESTALTSCILLITGNLKRKLVLIHSNTKTTKNVEFICMKVGLVVTMFNVKR